jgi:tRNA(Ile)-lysidine synthase TilS/MesJ
LGGLARHSVGVGLPEDGGESASFNYEEIKYFEANSPLRWRNSQQRRRFRETIADELEEEFPNLDSVELSFLSSVVLIQRKWR